MHVAVKPVLFAACWKLQVIDLVSLKVTSQHRISTKSLLPWRRSWGWRCWGTRKGRSLTKKWWVQGPPLIWKKLGMCNAFAMLNSGRSVAGVWISFLLRIAACTPRTVPRNTSPRIAEETCFYALHSYSSTPSFLPGFVHVFFDIILSTHPLFFPFKGPVFFHRRQPMNCNWLWLNFNLIAETKAEN